MKILAKSLLSSVFVFLPAVCFAQHGFGLDKDCGFAPALKMYTTERDGTLGGKVSPQIVEMLEDGQNCLNDNLIRLRASIKSLQSPLISNESFTTDILLLQDKLKQTEFNLHTAETKIETLEDRLKTAEETLQLLQLRASMPPRPARSPKATVSKPKAPVNKPTQQTAPKGNP
ncbi:MAG: hypothetical protein P4L95_02480 [Rouxiella aceris]|uniref:hypothetical protein n=1 Tax=Rouxiella aceris TaxID=2703884 RepID=UPI0028521D84|nr:hypothetical protein [Rouxiella aceris]MDR3430768.1 hypothetical protein [Rouxiella aceris]